MVLVCSGCGGRAGAVYTGSWDLKEVSASDKMVAPVYDTGDSSSTVDKELSALTSAVSCVASSDSSSSSSTITTTTTTSKTETTDTTTDTTTDKTGKYKKGKSLGTFKLTAYCPCRSCSGGYGRSTTLGPKAKAKHTIAADKSVLPLGTKVIIDGQLYRVEDTGSAVKGKVIDIFFDHHSETEKFGVKHKEVFLAVEK